jgi:hypothetical protein
MACRFMWARLKGVRSRRVEAVGRAWKLLEELRKPELTDDQRAGLIADAFVLFAEWDRAERDR